MKLALRSVLTLAVAGVILVPAVAEQEESASALLAPKLVRDTSSVSNLGNGADSGGEVSALAVQPDGKVLVGGNFTTWKGLSVKGLVRLNSDLSVDAAFTANVAAAPSHTAAFHPVLSITLVTDGAEAGDIWITGEFSSWAGNAAKGLVRLNADGSFDTAFTVWPSSATSSGKFRAFGMQSDGSMVVAIPSGSSWHPSGSSNCKPDSTCSLGRITPNQIIDTQFTTNGGVPNGTVSAIKVQSDDKILVGGQFTSLSGAAGGTASTAAHLVRFNSDGTRDTTFNANVQAVLSVGPVYSIGIQSDGKIIAVGNLRVTINSVAYSVKIARFNSDGTPDTGFLSNVGGATGGFTCIGTSCGTNTQVPQNVQILQNDEILVGGYFNGFGGTSDVNLVGPGVILLNSNGSLKASLGRAVNDGNASSGSLKWARSGAHEVNTVKTVKAVAQLANGSLMAAGDFKHWANTGCESGSATTSSTESCETNVGRVVVLNVLMTPTVGSVSPSSGSVGGGETLTVSGSNFLSSATVTIGGSPCASVSVISATQLTCFAPAGNEGLADIIVSNGAGYDATLASSYTYVAPPTVVSVSPVSGPAAGGTSLTVTGTGFLSGASVTVGGAACTGVTVVSATSITCTTPAGTAGAADVVVTNTDAQSGTGTGVFTYVAAPTVVSVGPVSGPAAGGTSLTVTGTGFLSGASVTVGGAACTGVTVVSATSITCTTPAGTAGAADVVVTNSDGQNGTGSGLFTFEAPVPAPAAPAPAAPVAPVPTTVPEAPVGAAQTPTTSVPPTTAPTPVLVTPQNQAQLEAEPGEGTAIINGAPAEVEIIKPTGGETPEQLVELANKIAEDLNKFLPKDTENPIEVVETDEGAELTGVMKNPDNPKEDIPVPVDSVTLVKAGDNTAMLVSALNQTNLPADINSGGSIEVTRGGTLSAIAYGMPSGEDGEIVLMSTPRLLTKFKVDESGTYRGQVPLPKDIEFGSHTVVMATKNAKVSLGIKLVRTRLEFRVKKRISTRLFLRRAGVKINRPVAAAAPKVTVTGSGRCKANPKQVRMAAKPGRCFITVKRAASGQEKAIFTRFTVQVVKKKAKVKTVAR